MPAHWSLMWKQRRYWELIAEGCWPADAGEAVGVSPTCARRWLRQRGDVNPQLQAPQGRIRPRLSPLERDEITIGTAQGESIRSIARRLGRAPSTIMRDIATNGHSRWAPGQVSGVASVRRQPRRLGRQIEVSGQPGPSPQ
jgi:IS30 family transposase